MLGISVFTMVTIAGVKDDAHRALIEAARLEEARVAKAVRLAAEEAARLEEERIAEEERLAAEEEERRLEEERIAEEERLAAEEEERRLEEERIAEEERLAAEEEERRLEEERIAEEERLAAEEEERRLEEERIAEEERLAAEEATRLEEEQKQANPGAGTGGINNDNVSDSWDYDYSADALAYNISGRRSPGEEYSAEDGYLLACTVSAETGWSPYLTQLAVANVILDRARNEGGMREAVFAYNQFAVTWDGALLRTFREGPRDLAVQAARDALAGKDERPRPYYYFNYIDMSSYFPNCIGEWIGDEYFYLIP
ncbi:MAG: cell wall hydrolase [Lachnospiraceae bacterium]